MNVINLQECLDRFSERWSPKIIAELNGQHVKLAKLEGEFVWHAHEREDELFLVLQGTLRILLEDGEIRLSEGEMAVIPRGMRHKPVADKEVHVLLFEPAATVNTGEEPAGEKTNPARWL